MSRYSIEDIARFVEGDMTEEERSQFKKQLQTDEELQAELEYYRHVHSSLKMTLASDTQEQKFRDTLTEIGKEHFKKEAKVVQMRRYAAWTSAIAAVFVLFMVWAPWNTDLYRQYADTEMLSVAERGEGDAEKNMGLAVESFNKKDFKTAKLALERVTSAEPDNAMAKYYYAITLIETGQIQKARENLTALYIGRSIFKYDAAFYMALSFLKEKNETQAILWLKKVPADAPIYEKSQELLEKLN